MTTHAHHILGALSAAGDLMLGAVVSLAVPRITRTGRGFSRTTSARTRDRRRAASRPAETGSRSTTNGCRGQRGSPPPTATERRRREQLLEAHRALRVRPR